MCKKEILLNILFSFMIAFAFSFKIKPYFFNIEGASQASRLSSGRPGFDARSWLPHHSSFHCIYPSYSSSSDRWGRNMLVPCIGALLQSRKRTRVAVVAFHVSLYPNSVYSSFLIYLCNIHVLIL